MSKSSKLAIRLAVVFIFASMAFNVKSSGYGTMVKLLAWKLRGSLHIHPLPRTLDLWAYTPTRDQSIRAADKRRVWGFWLFLRSLFDLNGYKLFEPTDDRWQYLLPPESPSQTLAKRKSEYPFGRVFYESDADTRFSCSSLRVWPARDQSGNDVIVRLISGFEPSEELKVWQRLHSAALKTHPRNRCIPVLDYIEFDGLTFIVMPRWGRPTFQDFATAEELLYFADCILDFVDFLHENRIFHRDLTEGNLAINVVCKQTEWYATGRCDPKDALYAVFDFGHSVAYSLESNLDEVTTTLNYGTELKQHGERNPFKVEVYWVAEMLQRYVRVTQEFIPEIVYYFENIIESDEAHRPSAREALEAFRQLQNSLSDEQLKTPLKYRFWERGKLVPKSEA